MHNQENNNTPVNGGVGFGGLLGLIFIVLKLCKVINWPWIWVLAPIWIPLAFILLLGIVLIIMILCQKTNKNYPEEEEEEKK